MPSAYCITTTLRPRAMPLRAYSARSRMICSGESYPPKGMDTGGDPLWLAQRGGRAVGVGHPLVQHRVDISGDLVVRQPSEAVRGDHGDDRPDPPRDVGPPGRRVVVGGVVERVQAG